MTREERELAITYLGEMKETYIEGEGYDRYPLPEYYAIEIAIEALEQEPCEDAISRQAVLDMMQMKMGGKELYMAVYDLPPVNPQEPKTGHWIARNSFLLQYKCSECGWESEKYNYCPNCGIRMKSEVEE